MQSLENFKEVNAIDEIWTADLIDRQAFAKDNIEIKYLLTVIDIFSKFVCIVPFKRKTGQKVANAFSRILKVRRPSKIWVDKGREFYKKDVQTIIELYSTENEETLVWFKDLIELLRAKCLSISLLIIQENLLMYLTYLQISTIMQFINQ